jgi:hypothetical protein
VYTGQPTDAAVGRDRVGRAVSRKTPSSPLANTDSGQLGVAASKLLTKTNPHFSATRREATLST